MTGWEALVAFNILFDEKPKLVEKAVLVTVRTRTGNKYLETAICYKRADGYSQKYSRAAAAGALAQQEDKTQNNKENSALAKQRDKLEKRGKKAPAYLVETVNEKRDPGVKIRKNGVEPERGGGNSHEISSQNVIFLI